MTKLNTILWIALLSLCSTTLLAQGDDDQPKDLGTENTEVITGYDPTLADAVKVNFQPTIPIINAEKRELTYTIPTTVLPVNYDLISVKPLGIAKEKPIDYPSSYLKLGFGTQLSPLVELLFNDGKKPKRREGKYSSFHYGIYFKHLSARASKLDHQDFSDNDVKVFMNKYFKKAKLSTVIDYNQRSRFYYGFSNSDTSFTRKESKQSFQNFEATVDLVNTTVEKSDFSYHATFNASYYKDRFDLNETDININLNAQKIFKDDHYVTLDIYEDYSIFSSTVAPNVNRNIFAVKPKYMFNDQSWRVFGGVNLVWEGSTFHVLPDLGMERSLWDDHLILFTGWRTELHKNSYKSLSTDNPYVDNDFGLLNTRTESRFIEVKGTAAKNFSYRLKFAQKIVRKLPLFVNDPMDERKFNVVYDGRTIILNVHAELNYRVKSNLNFNLTGDFYNFEMDNVARPWHLARFEINFSTNYQIGEKISLRLDIHARDGVWTLKGDGTEEKLKGTADINIGGTYKFSKYLTFFANLNNLASIKYQQYYRYPGYGFNGMVGAILTY